jgi:CheY-like chemotaxis protein
MMSLLHRLIGASVEIIFKPSVEIPLMEVDRGQIEQVIVNLVVNARDAMPDGGTITIETQVMELEEEASRGKQVVLKVTDTGTGMDSATQSKIFEPFFTQSRGTVRVESEIGRGTSFTFHFPVATGPMEKPGPLEPRSVLGGNETILVVEDEQEMRTLLEKILRGRGYQVLTAARPSDALRIADEYKAAIHLLLTDMVMPEMNGAILSARVKTAHPEIAIVQMSGYSGYHEETPSSGKNGAVFLQKPFTPDTVARVVREALDPKFRRREVTDGSEVAGIWGHGRKRGGGGRSPGG